MKEQQWLGRAYWVLLPAISLMDFSFDTRHAATYDDTNFFAKKDRKKMKLRENIKTNIFEVARTVRTPMNFDEFVFIAPIVDSRNAYAKVELE